MKTAEIVDLGPDILELDDTRAGRSKSPTTISATDRIRDDTNATAHPAAMRTTTPPNNAESRPSPPTSTRRHKIKRSCIVGSSLALIVLVQLLYICGALSNLDTRVSKLSVVVVDYDGGLIGLAAQEVLREMTGSSSPTFAIRPQSEYPNSADLRTAVRHRKYWGALWIAPNATGRLWAAMKDPTRAADYAAGEVAIEYTWNGVYFSTFAQSFVGRNIGRAVDQTERLVSSKATESLTSHGIGTMLTAQQAEVLGYPCPTSAIALDAHRVAGSTAFSTLAIIWVSIPSQFLIGILAFILMGQDLWLQLAAAVLFSGAMSFVVVVSSWALKGQAGSDLKAGDFFLTLLVLWPAAMALYINFQALRDVLLLTGGSRPLSQPPRRITLASFAWTLTNMVSVVAPTQLSPPFYTWGRFLPGYAMYSWMTHVWVRNPVSAMWPEMLILGLWIALGTGLVAVSHWFRQRSRTTKKPEHRHTMIAQDQAQTPRTRSSHDAV